MKGTFHHTIGFMISKVMSYGSDVSYNFKNKKYRETQKKESTVNVSLYITNCMLIVWHVAAPEVH